MQRMTATKFMSGSEWLHSPWRPEVISPSSLKWDAMDAVALWCCLLQPVSLRRHLVLTIGHRSDNLHRPPMSCCGPGSAIQYTCTGVNSVNGQQIPLLQFVLLKCYRIGTSGTHKSWKIGN